MTAFGYRPLLVALLIVAPTFVHAKEAAVKPNDNQYTLERNIKYTKTGKDGEDDRKEKAFDVSGIACVVLKKNKRRCLVINDEGSEALFVKIDDFDIEPESSLMLLEALPDAKTAGSLPDRIGCTGKRSDDLEFDGEGVAYAKDFFYVVGSHGCGRKKDAFKPSAMLLARIPVDEEGRPKGKVETTFRLGQALAKADTVGEYHLKSLKEASNGLNLEGVAVIGERLFAGLRAPNLDGKAYLVAVPLDGLFAPGPEPFKGTPEVIALEVGDGAGIRDLSVTEKGRLLVLTGPAQEQADVPAKLFLFDPTAGGPPELRVVLKDLKDEERCGKAEAAIQIGRDRVLVLFDGLKNGGPREYDVSLD